MKILVTTERSQGTYEGDYNGCIPGELAWLPLVCDRDRRDPGRGCGCSRGFGGLASHRATTTVEVADLEMTERDIRLAYETSLRDQGWIPTDASPVQVEDILDETLGLARDIAEALPPGTVLRRDFDEVHAYPMYL